MHATALSQNNTHRSRAALLACIARGLKECRDIIRIEEPLPAAHRRFLKSQAVRPSNGVDANARALLAQIEAAQPVTTARTVRGKMA